MLFYFILGRFTFRHSASVSSLAERLVVWMTSVGKSCFVILVLYCHDFPALPGLGKHEERGEALVVCKG